MTETETSRPETAGEAEIPLRWAFVSVGSLIALLTGNWLVLPKIWPAFEMGAHLPLAIAAAVAASIARMHGWRWDKLQEGMVHGVMLAMPAILILYIVGALIGTWIAAGIIPALIDWGLALMSPAWFLPATCAVCSVVSLVCGSSWSTAGTVGIALIGVGHALGINPGYTAGAVVSGAYFGDKLSPMSETTNLAPGVAGANLFVHIRHMLWTTVPSWLIAMIAYTVIGLGLDGTASLDDIAKLRSLIQTTFEPGIVHLLPPVLVFVLVLRKMPALPSLAAGAVAAVVLGTVSGVPFIDLLAVSMDGYKPSTGNAAFDSLMARGGIKSMSDTVLLITAAMCFGGVMERTGQLGSIARVILRTAKSANSLVVSTILTAVGLNLLAADQYIAIIVPGRMFKGAYESRGLAPQNLSRALEDGGTITSALVPWNSCGAYMASTLGVATGAYLPFAFVNLLNPLFGIAYAMTGVSLVRKSPTNGDDAIARGST